MGVLVGLSYEQDYRRFVAGGAQGVDTIFADVVLELREDKPDVELLLAVPFIGQEKRWPEAGQARYKSHLEAANRVYIVNEERDLDLAAAHTEIAEIPYHLVVRALYGRNSWMVDNSDALLAIWSGKQQGGTYHCLNYAKKWGKVIVRYDPFTGEITRLKESPEETK